MKNFIIAKYQNNIVYECIYNFLKSLCFNEKGKKFFFTQRLYCLF